MHHAKNEVVGGFGVTPTFAADCSCVDEIRIAGNDSIVAVDDLDLEPGRHPGPPIASAACDAITGGLALTSSLP